MDVGAATHPGYVREGNEDGFFASGEHAVFAVADGMGGHEHGEIASHLALEAIIRHADAISHAAPTELPTLLHQSMQDANTAILSQAITQDARNRMGTTLVLATIYHDRLYFAHLGDSRLYLLRGDLFTQLTRDHSLVQAMVDRGELTPDEAAIHPLRHQITRVVGNEDHISPEIASQALEPGDVILLCTDGLSGAISAEAVKAIISTPRGAQEKADALVQAALDAGGPDNITALVIGYLTPRLSSPARRHATALNGLSSWQSWLLSTGIGIIVLAGLLCWHYLHPFIYITTNTRGELGVYKRWPLLPMLGKAIIPTSGFTLMYDEARPLLTKYGDIRKGIAVKNQDIGLFLLQDIAKQTAANLLETAKQQIEHGNPTAARETLAHAKTIGADPRLLHELETMMNLHTGDKLPAPGMPASHGENTSLKH